MTQSILNAAAAGLAAADIGAVSPALDNYTHGTLFGNLWQRPALSVRDRCLVTLAALIARGQAAPLAFYVPLALDNGVAPLEVSELITHLAFYAGWGNAMAAVAVTKSVFAARQIAHDQLAAVAVDLLPLDAAVEAQRAAAVEKSVGVAAPGVVQLTAEVLFHDLWLRPGLAPRDRSLVTFSALVAASQVAQIPYHLNRAMDNGLTQEQAAESLTQLAFYAGWPNVFSAIPVAKGVFEQRAAPPSAS